MNNALQMLTLVRHGETAWTSTRPHTGWTDLLLNEEGKRQARELGVRLSGLHCNVLAALSSSLCALVGRGRR